MELSHSFTVPAPVEATWAAFNDIESVAGCFPGATVASVEGDDFKGSCKVKLGPIALVYSGAGTFVQRDESARRFVIEAKGKDKRGNGTAGATVTAILSPASPEGTRVEVGTDLSITGKPAQFGRGLIQDVSDKLLQQFVTCLESKVGAAQPAATPTDEPSTAPAEQASVAQPRAEVPVPEPVPAASVAAAPAPEQEDDALDLGATVLPVLLKSYGKQLAALGAVLLALFLICRLVRR